MMAKRLKDTLEHFRGKRIVVAGDLMLDRYWWGTVERISPEAPVPVVRKNRASTCPGGAANAACNVAALGGEVALLGMIGADEAGKQLSELLIRREIDCSAVFVDPRRPTTVKTRVIAHDQHVARIDEEDSTPLDEEAIAEVVRRAERTLASADAVIISDYGKGFLAPALLSCLLELAGKFGLLAVVDPKGCDYRRYLGASVIKPNRAELAALTGMSVSNHEESLIAGRRLLELMVPTAILVTEGKEGMTIFELLEAERQLPAFARQIYDVTGAGDTVTAVLTLALASGSDITEASWLSNLAAGLAVGQVATVAVCIEELRAALEDQQVVEVGKSASV